MTRKKKLILNTGTSLVYQAVSIICNFVLPRFFLMSYGSSVNGLISSVTHFLSIISLCQMGVGAVVQSALYQPLAERDVLRINEIVISSQRFFRKIAIILVVYTFMLMFGYPLLVKAHFDYFYTALLIFIISTSTFAQYYFGMTNQLLLTADQLGFVYYTAHGITLILNTFLSVLLMRVNASVHVVKLVSSIVFLLQPWCMAMVVKRRYTIDYRLELKKEPIQQKWNGVAQHIASVVLDSSAPIILTVFSTLSNVSIYSVYNLVIQGVKQLFLSTTNGARALLGELWAKREYEELNKFFFTMEWLIHTATVFVFGCTGTLILPFVRVYTDGISDAEYIQPLFAVLYTVAHAGHCLRLPYNIMILAAGHYKQTQSNYIIAALLNIMVSIVGVKLFGIIGVALGAMVALFYQTIWMAWYSSQNFVKRPMYVFWKQMTVNGITTSVGVILTKGFLFTNISYFSWLILAIKTAIVWSVIICLLNLIFYREKMITVFGKLKSHKE